MRGRWRPSPLTGPSIRRGPRSITATPISSPWASSCTGFRARCLDVYCAKNIFGPLGLKDTSFSRGRLSKPGWRPATLRCGEVQDPTAYRMGGVAGNAGVFSTADDLAVFAQMILDGGTWRGRRILSPEAVAAMTKPQGVPGNATRRGLGWDIRSPYSRIFNAAFPAGSFGHTGYTGTSIWIEPRSKTYLIILTNRLYPNGKGEVKALRAKIAAAVAAAVPMGPPALAALDEADPDLTMGGHGASDTPDRVQPGIEVLAASGFAALKGKNVGVITNHTGVDAAGRSTLSRLLQAPGVKVRAIFSPEHGLAGNLDEKVASGRDPATGLPVYSLYGKTNPRPRCFGAWTPWFTTSRMSASVSTLTSAPWPTPWRPRPPRVSTSMCWTGPIPSPPPWCKGRCWTPPSALLSAVFPCRCATA